MFSLKKKNLVYLASVSLLLIVVCSLAVFFRPALIDSLKSPLTLVTFAGQEIKALVFFHQNYYESQRLRKQVDLLRQRLNDLQEVSLENQRLKNLLNFKQQSAFKVIAAKVIARSADNWSSVAIIDKGSRSGVKAGMFVITQLGFAGRVSETSAAAGKVMLVSDPDFAVSALIQRSRQEGLVSGTLGNYLVMRYMPKDSDVKISDTVVTSGLTGVCPKGLIIGVVADVGDEFSGLSRYCLIKPAVNPSSIEEVLIIQ